MALITARKIHNGNKWLPDNSTIEVAEDGTILAVHDGPIVGAAFYDGILVPGFVNAHCHLELSHMKGMVPTGTGLIPFLRSVPTHRNDFDDRQKLLARQAAYREMVDTGIVAIGDIANTTEALDLRANRDIHICTFVEAIGFTETRAMLAFEHSLGVYQAYSVATSQDMLHKAFIAPHAPYSVSPALFGLIDRHIPDGIISIHNQESRAEDQFFHDRTGAVLDLLGGLGLDFTTFQPTGNTSLASYSAYLSPDHTFMPVHNTFTTLADVQLVAKRFKEVTWCLCPNANLYIEDSLPDVPMLAGEGRRICIGTDSLASNYELSVLGELQTIHKHFPVFSWEQLLTWGTANGAKALQMDDRLGTIEPGKKPGIMLLSHLDDDEANVDIARLFGA